MSERVDPLKIVDILNGMANQNGHGGYRRGAGRPRGSRNARPASMYHQARELLAVMGPVKFQGDSREFLNATKNGDIDPKPQQIYAAKSLLSIEYPPAVAHDGRSVEEIKAEGVREYLAAQPDSNEALLAAINRLRQDCPASERARHSLADILADDTGNLSPEDAEWIEEIAAEVERCRPTVARIAELIPPAVRPKKSPMGDFTDVVTEAPSVELGAKSGGKVGVPQTDQPYTHRSTHHSASDGQHFGANSDPAPVHEITPEETAVVSALPPHLLPGRWRQN